MECIERGLFRVLTALFAPPASLPPRHFPRWQSEFVLVLLQLMGKVAEKDILMAAKIFEGMDVDDTGVLREAVRGLSVRI